MRLDQMVRILDGVPGIRKEGPVYLLPEHTEFGVFVALPSETIVIGRVARVDPSAEMLAVDTQKGERFVFSLEHVAGVKSAAADKAAARGAGFSKT